MRWLKALVIAFSLYSKIPMPQFAWKDEDMKYVLCFFPWVGAVIGACLWGWLRLCGFYGLHPVTCLFLGAAIPILLTGGFHIDGFMDTMDALCSYRDRERKLEILKDSHIGAFSVLSLLTYYLIYLAVFAEIREEKMLLEVSAGFVLSRCLSGIGAVVLRPARKDGMLRELKERSAGKIVLLFLSIQLAAVAAFMLALSWKAGGLILVLTLGFFGYYRYRSYREFGGVTGDTAGFFLVLCEMFVAVGAALGGRL